MPKSNYDRIATEYYDEGHVTSRNFDAATKARLAGASQLVSSSGLVLEVGAGKGRANEFLGIEEHRIVQLDSSEQMFQLPDREPCLLKVVSDACSIPLDSGQFSAVIGFLVDPFLGLDFLGEAFRVLREGGELLLTTPSHEWGEALRSDLGITVDQTRFKVLRAPSEEEIKLPSLLHRDEKLQEMLELCGFKSIVIEGLKLPQATQTVSKDIKAPADKLGLSAYELPIVQLIKANK